MRWGGGLIGRTQGGWKVPLTFERMGQEQQSSTWMFAFS